MVQRSRLGGPTPLTPSMVPVHVGWYHGPSTKGMFIVLKNYQLHIAARHSQVERER